MVMFGKFFGLKQRDKLDEESIQFLRRTLAVYSVIFIFWGLYRLLLRLPIFIEELLIKPLVYVPPALSVVEQERGARKGRLKVFGFRKSGLFLSIYFGLTLGVSFFLAVGLGGLIFSGSEVLKISQFSLLGVLHLLAVSLATAFWEQFIFSGFFLLRFWRIFKDEWLSATLTAILFTLLHLPIILLDSSFYLLLILIQLVLLFMVGFGNAILMLRTRNIMAPILSHAFWALALQIIM